MPLYPEDFSGSVRSLGGGVVELAALIENSRSVFFLSCDMWLQEQILDSSISLFRCGSTEDFRHTDKSEMLNSWMQVSIRAAY